MADILHCDLNNFFASAECMLDPTLKGLPVAVGGAEEDRHGVVVAANYLAKNFGVHCGVTTYQAKKLCPNIVIKTPHFKEYNDLSHKVRNIYLDYTDQIEVFSIDECFLDVTHSKVFGSPEGIAYIIKERVKKEIGLTISVGVSFTKTFAKIGSDLKKPDAVTVISKDNYKQVVWPLPINAMVGIGRKTNAKLERLGIHTLGDLARLDEDFMTNQFGKVGTELSRCVRGVDNLPVTTISQDYKPKSVGNSTTFYKDLKDIKDIRLGFTVISESIVKRMIEYDILCAHTLSIVIKDNKLNYYQKQTTLMPYRDSIMYTNTALDMYKKYFSNVRDIRLLGISVSNWGDGEVQMDFLSDPKQTKDLDKSIYNIRKKFGDSAIVKANMLCDKKIGETFLNESLNKYK